MGTVPCSQAVFFGDGYGGETGRRTILPVDEAREITCPKVIGVEPSPCAAPYPVFSPLYQPHTPSISLDVAAHCVKMLVALYRERLERALVEVSFAFPVMSLLPATHVGRRHLVQECGQLIVKFGPQHKIPVVWHETVSEDPHGNDQ
jgi:hypothetical protein